MATSSSSMNNQFKPGRAPLAREEYLLPRLTRPQNDACQHSTTVAARSTQVHDHDRDDQWGAAPRVAAFRPPRPRALLEPYLPVALRKGVRALENASCWPSRRGSRDPSRGLML